MKNIWRFISFLLIGVIGIGLCTIVFINRPRTNSYRANSTKVCNCWNINHRNHPLSTILYGEMLAPSNYEINSHLDTDVLNVYVKEGTSNRSVVITIGHNKHKTRN